MLKVLLVEDDSQISKSLSMSLSFSGFEVATAETLAQAWTKISNRPYDIILLDVGLPDGSGIDLCQRIRAAGKTTPILFLSARVDEETVVKGMNFGADDYIRKPFGTEELKVRMNKALKRVPPAGNRIEAGSLVMDLDKRFATISGKPINLGKREFDILAYIAKKAGDVVTRDSILERLDEKPEVYDRTIDSHMSHLRRKLRDAGGDVVQIVAVYGVGYRLQFTTGAK
jgi:DNA-binding response OmpR family regulator